MSFLSGRSWFSYKAVCRAQEPYTRIAGITFSQVLNITFHHIIILNNHVNNTFQYNKLPTNVEQIVLKGIGKEVIGKIGLLFKINM